MVLLSGRPQEQPQELALLSNPQARHVAFEVETLAKLRELYAVAPNHHARILFSFDHGGQLRPESVRRVATLGPHGGLAQHYVQARGAERRRVMTAAPHQLIAELREGRRRPLRPGRVQGQRT
jgi:hypothetical protein